MRELDPRRDAGDRASSASPPAPGSSPAITKDWDFWELLLPQILRGVSLMLCMVPINNIALGTLPPERLKNASGLFNLTRNLGGAVGLALINTVLNDRMDLHLQRLHETRHLVRAAALERLDQPDQAACSAWARMPATRP